MKRMILIPMTLAVAGWTAAAKAEVVYVYRDYHSRSGSALSIRSIADRMEDATSDLYNTATAEAQSFGEESVFYDDFGNRVVSSTDGLTEEESLALQRLHELDFAARRFQLAVERRWWNPSEARAEYRMLLDAHTRASASIGGLHASSTVYDQFQRVDRLMDELIDRMA